MSLRTGCLLISNHMTRFFHKYLFGLLVLAVSGLFSCSKEGGPAPGDSSEARVDVSVVGETPTRASGSGHGNQPEDNTVRTLDVFLYNAAGMLESYVHTDGTASCSFRATVGRKSLYVLVNNHDVAISPANLQTLANFKAVTTSVKKEALKSFTMIGSKDVTLAASNSISVPVHRLCARIRVSSLKTDFSGTPYAGATLNDVKIYVLNAHASNLIWNGADPSVPTILNNRKYSADCNSGVSMDGILQSTYTKLADGVAQTTVLYFYPYANTIATETESGRFTRLTVEGTLMLGTQSLGKHYWSVNVNRKGFGYVSGTPGVEANHSYTMDIVIRSIGSPSPDIIPEDYSVDVDLRVVPWTVVTDRHEF